MVCVARSPSRPGCVSAFPVSAAARGNLNRRTRFAAVTSARIELAFQWLGLNAGIGRPRSRFSGVRRARRGQDRTWIGRHFDHDIANRLRMEQGEPRRAGALRGAAWVDALAFPVRDRQDRLMPAARPTVHEACGRNPRCNAGGFSIRRGTRSKCLLAATDRRRRTATERSGQKEARTKPGRTRRKSLPVHAFQ